MLLKNLVFLGNLIFGPTGYRLFWMEFDTIEGYHIKIGKKSKEQSTILVDGREGYFAFASQKIPLLFREVLKKKQRN